MPEVMAKRNYDKNAEAKVKKLMNESERLVKLNRLQNMVVRDKARGYTRELNKGLALLKVVTREMKKVPSNKG